LILPLLAPVLVSAVGVWLGNGEQDRATAAFLEADRLETSAGTARRAAQAVRNQDPSGEAALRALLQTAGLTPGVVTVLAEAVTALEAGREGDAARALETAASLATAGAAVARSSGEGAREAAGLIVLLGFAAATVTFAIGGIVVADAIARPLHRIGGFVRRVASGDLAGRLPAGAQDEFGAVMDDLNAMADALQQTQRSLEWTNSELARRADTLRRTTLSAAALAARPPATLGDGALHVLRTECGAQWAGIARRLDEWLLGLRDPLPGMPVSLPPDESLAALAVAAPGGVWLGSLADLQHADAGALQEAGLRSVVAISGAVRPAETWVAVLGFETDPPNIELSTIEPFVRQVLSLVETAELLLEREDRIRRLRLLAEVSAAVRSGGDAGEILSGTAREVGRALRAAASHAVEIDGRAVLAPTHSGRRGPGEPPGHDEIAAHPLVRRLVESPRGATPHVVTGPAARLALREGQGQALAVPLGHQDALLGVLVLERTNPFADWEVDLARSVGAQAGALLANARLVKEAREEADFEAALSRLATAVTERRELSRTLSEAAVALRRAAGLDGAAIFLATAPGGLRVAASEGAAPAPGSALLPYEDEAVAQLSLVSPVLVVSDRADEPLLAGLAPHLEACEATACVLAAMRYQGEFLGFAMALGRTRREWRHRDVEVTRRIAQQSAAAAHAARLAAALSRSERSFQGIFEGASDGIVLIDEDGRVALANPRMAELLGRPAADLVGASIDRLLPGYTHDPSRRASVETVVTRGRGQSLWVELNSAPLEGGRALAVARDVTERIRLRRYHETTNRQWRALLSSLRDLGARLDPDQLLQGLVEASVAVIPGADAGSVVTVDRARPEEPRLVVRGAAGARWAATRGLSWPLAGSRLPEVFAGQAEAYAARPDEVFDPAWAAAVRAAGIELPGGPALIAPIRREGQLHGFLAIHAAHRDQAFEESDPEVLSAYAEQAAVALRNAELYSQNLDLLDETREQRRLGEAVLDASGEGIVAADADGRVLLSNRRFSEILGFEPGERVETAGPPFSGPDEFDWTGPDFAGTQESAGSGPARTLRRYQGPVLDPERGEIGRVYSFRDVTQERAADRVKADFVATVSHELRTPLTAIKGSLQLLSSRTGGSDSLAGQLLDISLGNTDRLIRLINDILDMSKIEHGRMQMSFMPGRVDEIARAVARELAPVAGPRRVRILVNTSGDAEPVAFVDASRLHQVLINLIGNAIKFSPDEGTITVSVARSERHVDVRVRDVGPGVPARDQGRLFQRFGQLYTGADRQTGGTGLGLAISKAIVEAHGGEIWLESPPADDPKGRGSVFAFRVPCDRRTRPRPPETVPADTVRERYPAVVLVVHPAAGVRATLRRELEAEGLGVVEAAEYEEGVRLAEQIPISIAVLAGPAPVNASLIAPVVPLDEDDPATALVAIRELLAARRSHD
jgi:PAS domain S-box-containing protein